MIKVRATQDGVYGGYYRYGPQAIGTPEYTPGEVFEIDEKPFIVKNSKGEPEYERDLDGTVLFEMENGKPKIGKDNKKVPKIRMGSYFAESWMERVNDDATVTNEYPPFQLPVQMRAVKIAKQTTEAVPMRISQSEKAQLENVI
jgi:hypothetical protein